MKSIVFLWVLGFCLSINAQNTASSAWSDHAIDKKQLQINFQNEYVMLDSLNNNIGSMVFSQQVEGDKLMVRDISTLQDESMLEKFHAIMNMGSMKVSSVSTNIHTPSMEVITNLSAKNNIIKGDYSVTQNGNNVEIEIDSLYDYDIFRFEIYSILPALKKKTGDSMQFKVLYPISMSTFDCTLEKVKDSEIISINGKSHDTEVYFLKTPNQILDNQIWVDKKSPKRILRFYVPKSAITIELKNSIMD